MWIFKKLNFSNPYLKPYVDKFYINTEILYLEDKKPHKNTFSC